MVSLKGLKDLLFCVIDSPYKPQAGASKEQYEYTSSETIIMNRQDVLLTESNNYQTIHVQVRMLTPTI